MEDWIITGFFVLVILYMYINAIIGIVRKKIALPLLTLIAGVRVMHWRDIAVFEGEEAIGAAVFQLFFATIGAVSMIGLFLEMKGIISYELLIILFRVIISAFAIVAVYYTVKMANKIKKKN